MTLAKARTTRRGAVAPLLAILLVPLVTMVAFGIDLGRVAMTTAEMQNAADAAALAGVDQMMQGYVVYNTSGNAGVSNPPNTAQTAAVSTYCTAAANNAIYFAASHANSDLSSVTVVLGDIEFGYTRSDGTYTKGFMANGSMGAVNDSVDGYQFPNTITVYAARGPSYASDGTATGNTPNAQIGLFFGTVIGVTQLPTSVMARSVLLTGQISGLGVGMAMLPLTMDYNVWNAYIYQQTSNKQSKLLLNPYGGGNSGQDLYGGFTDSKGFVHPGYSNLLTSAGTSASNALSTQADPNNSNINMLQAFPTPGLTPGSFGWLSMNNSSVSASALAGWIASGLSSSDIAALTTKNTVSSTSGASVNDNLYPITSADAGSTGTAHSTTTFDWQGITGMKESDLSALSSYVGTTGFLPLFAPLEWSVSGSGKKASSSYESTTKNPINWANSSDSMPSSGTGVNDNYSIIGYVGVKIAEVQTGGTKALWIEPAAVMPAGATFINPNGTPASSSTFSYTMMPAKLVK